MQLVASQLTIVRGDRLVISDLSFKVSAGRALVLTGANGSGKTSLLRTLAGFLRPGAGELRLEGGDADRTLAEHCHYIGHRAALKSSLTALENLAFWNQYFAESARDMLPGRSGAALDSFGMLGLGDIPVAYLSAGQKHRIALARLLLAYRPIWLLDEPTASLDAASQGILDAVIDRHLRSGGIAVIATHQPLDVGPQHELRLDAGAEDV
jgi:heme exporter protein A